MRHVIVLMIWLVFFPRLLPANEVVHIPRPIDAQAVFIQAKEAPNKTDRLLVANKDGARVVVGGVAMITAVRHSEILKVDDSNARITRISLGKGGFYLHVGSTPVVFDLSKISVSAHQVALRVARHNGGWLLETSALFGEGHVKIMLPEDTVIAKKGQVFQISSGTVSVDASKEAGDHLKKISSRLKSNRSSPLLSPKDVEDPMDLATQTSKDDAITDIELEAIEVEVEAGCVEICVD